MKNVLLIDSGSGGINILKRCVEIVPYCNFLMFCDDKNLPYGNKTPYELQTITIDNLKKINKFFKFDIVILACNTLTSTCIETCRKTFPRTIFIGTVPAVKPALEKYEPKDILVLATPVTIKHNATINKTQGLTLKSMDILASLIDQNLDTLENIEPYLQNELKEMHPKAIVLGCTHYFAIKDLISKFYNNTVELFDSADGVARRLKSFVNKDCAKNYQVQIMITSNNEFLPKLWWYFQKP